MFKRPASVKNLSVLRSSDRKKIIQQVSQSFSLETLDSDAKNSLLPEGAQSAKFTTHLDEPGVLYYDPHGSEPLWIKIIPPSLHDEVLLPTVYTLWQNPPLLKTVSTWDHVLEKLQGGADLMTPGLTKWDPEIKSGDVVAVTLQDGVPIAVGIAAFNLGRLSKAVGEKGKAVYLVHCYRDDLWAVGSKKHPPKPVPSNGNTELDDATLALSLDSKEDDQQVSNEVVLVDLVETLPEPRVDESREIEPEPSTADIDNAFKAAAIYGLYQIKQSEAQNSVSLPMLSSTLVSNHLNPYLLEPFAQMNFKKTSWKKVATFLKKNLEKEGVVKTKDRAGETVILSINWNHKLITEFEPYRLGHQGPAKSAKSDSVSSRSMIQVHDLYKPSGKAFKALLESISKPKDDLYTASQVRECLSQYIIQNSDLVDPRNPRFVKIDYNLAPLLKPGESNLVFLPRDNLLDRLLESCHSYYTISTDSETQTRKGKPPKIHVVLEKRQGRKTVTRFWGLEAFFLSPNELAEELRNTCATSASVGALQSSTPKQPLMEVLIQGPQTNAVVDALEKRGIRKTFIVVEDKRK